jgi:mannose-6-phosphate isomerase
MREAALPFWLERASDARGLFYETLAMDGTPEPGALRLRTGMRQAYVFAHAAQLGLSDRVRSLALAARMMDALRAVAWSPDGRPGWVARFARDGAVLDDRRDLYDHAFALLALGHLAEATGEARYRTWIDQTVAVVEGMHAPHGGWHQNDRRELPRSQNPHMHLFEASLALFETTGEARHLARAGEIFGLLRGRFIDPETGLLTEFFGPVWERSPTFRSERLDPGHMMEWTWLLRRYARATGHRVEALCGAMFGRSLRLGLDPSGFLVDEVDARGRPLVDSRRLWPQTEYLKALIVQAAAQPGVGRAGMLAEADALVGRLLASYLAAVPHGTWQDRFDLGGRPTATMVPASTLYHLLAPAAEILRLRGQAVCSDRPSMK